MAFCPECGKAAPAGAEICASCGFGLAPEGKKGAGRFNGTVIMSAPVVKSGEAANRNAAAKSQPAPASVKRSASRSSSPAKQRLKATMIGPGGRAPTVASSAHNEPAVIKTPIVQAVVIKTPIVDAVEVETLERSTTPGLPAIPSVIVDMEPLPPSPVPARPTAHYDDDAASRQQAGFAQPDPAHRYLPGDPMAPQPRAAARSTPRLLLNDESMRDVDDKKWMYWAICAVIALTATVLAFGLF